MLSPDTLVGYSEAAKCARITKVEGEKEEEKKY
jgi:hypothetical protein